MTDKNVTGDGEGENMIWPWPGHEEHGVQRLLMNGACCGRICKQCNVAEVHVVIPPGGGRFEGEFDIEPILSGSA
jgi:hypothetical protein